MSSLTASIVAAALSLHFTEHTRQGRW